MKKVMLSVVAWAFIATSIGVTFIEACAIFNWFQPRDVEIRCDGGDLIYSSQIKMEPALMMDLIHGCERRASGDGV